MSGFLLTGGTGGCPPTETPPVGYGNPFRFDDAGRLWISQCFQGLQYFGAARHDIGSSGVLGAGSYPVDSGGLTVPVTAGTYTDITITNETDCTLGVLLSYDMFVDIQANAANLVRFVIAGRWNGVYQSQNACSSVRIDGQTMLVRNQAVASANPHDPAIEAGGSAGMTLTPGDSATIGCQLFLQYAVGSATGSEALFSANSAVRAYGYVLV